MGANPRSTVGTATDANAMLRILFSRLGDPYVGPPTAYSFNVPTRKASGMMTTEKGGRTERRIAKQEVYLGGMCPRCEGMGKVNDIDLTALYDEDKSLSEGALTVPTVERTLAPMRSWSRMIAVVSPSSESTSGRASVGMKPCTKAL